MDTAIRRANAADLDAAAALFDAYRRFYGQAGDLPRARAFLAERIDRGESVVLLAEAGGATLGSHREEERAEHHHEGGGARGAQPHLVRRHGAEPTSLTGSRGHPRVAGAASGIRIRPAAGPPCRRR